MTPLERAARAAEIAAVEKTAHHPVSAEMAKLSWLWQHVARAVLQAIREPSEGMKEAGAVAASTADFPERIDMPQPYEERGGELRAEWRGEVRASWQAMLDAALGEGDARE